MSNALAVHSLGSFDTDIVIDVGCLSWQRGSGVEDSIHTLIKRFQPKLLFGFDIHPALPEKIGNVNGTTVLTSRKAAWSDPGTLGVEMQGNCTHVMVGGHGEGRVDCFDLARFIKLLPESTIVLKLDAEGAEYVLLPHLIKQGAMAKISRLLVEWHEGQYANGWEVDRSAIVSQISCPVEEWQ